MHEMKKVSHKELRKGQQIKGVAKIDGDMQGQSYFSGEVTKVEGFGAYVSVFGREPKFYGSEYKFLVECTDSEIEAMYKDEAVDRLAGINTKLAEDEIGMHTMYNSWLYSTIYEMAKECKNNGMRIAGYCTDILPKKGMYDNQIYDVGVCIEYDDDFSREWCHYTREHLQELQDEYRKIAS